MIRGALPLLACCAVTWMAAAPADATWTARQQFAAPYASAPAVAINGATTVVAWASRQRITRTRYGASVNVAVRDARGRLRTRRLWRSGHAEVTGLSVVVDRRGQITVAWAHWDRARQVPSGIVRAAYGSAGATFTRSHVVGKAGSGDGPSLAVAPDGTVLMVWNGRFGDRDRERDAVAWRGPGRRFGAVRALSDSSRAPSDPDGLSAAFDARGVAYVFGSCTASVMRAPARSRRLRGPIVLGGRVRGFSLSLNGAGRGLASWAAGKCSYGVEDPAEPGPVLASVLRAGTFGAPVAVTAAGVRANGTTAVALPGGAGIVGFRVFSPTTFDGQAFTASLAATGLGPPQPVTDGLAVAQADAGGDLLLEDSGFTTSSGRIVMRPAGGLPDEPAPAGAHPVPAARATDPAGRGAALVWTTVADNDIDAPTQRLALSLWRP